MALEEDLTSVAAIEKYINKRVLTNGYAEGDDEKKVMTAKSETVEKVEVRRNPQSHQIKAVKIDSHFLNMTIDTGSQVSLLNWASTKPILEGPTNSKIFSGGEA